MKSDPMSGARSELASEGASAARGDPPRPGLPLSGVLLGILLLSSLPFLPGSHDALAVPLSASAQLFGMLSVGLLPVGIIWHAAQKLSAAEPRRAEKVATFFARLALGVTTLALTASALIAIQDGGVTLGIALVTLLVTLALRTRRALRSQELSGRLLSTWGPRYMIAVPLTAILVRFWLVPALAEASRMRAITNAAPLIAGIEEYHRRNGSYPLSLASVNTDFPPGVKGIARYHYERNGEGYNVFFEHMAYALDAREVVMYNPYNAHEATSHDSDLLEYDGEALQRRRGYYASLSVGGTSWRRFLFD